MVYLKPMSIINTSELRFLSNMFDAMNWKKTIVLYGIQIENVEGKYGLSLNINFIESFARNYPLNDKTNFALDCVMLL